MLKHVSAFLVGAPLGFLAGSSVQTATLRIRMSDNLGELKSSAATAFHYFAWPFKPTLIPLVAVKQAQEAIDLAVLAGMIDCVTIECKTDGTFIGRLYCSATGRPSESAATGAVFSRHFARGDFARLQALSTPAFEQEMMHKPA